MRHVKQYAPTWTDKIHVISSRLEIWVASLQRKTLFENFEVKSVVLVEPKRTWAYSLWTVAVDTEKSTAEERFQRKYLKDNKHNNLYLT